MNQTVLITGASQGLGRELALKLTAQNFSVIGLARDKLLLKKLSQQIKDRFDYFVCDIHDRNQVTQTVKQLIDKHANLDILITNAGVWTDDQLLQQKPELLDNAIHTNLLGQIYVTETLLPYFKQKNTGKNLLRYLHCPEF